MKISRHYEAIILKQSRDCIHYLWFTKSTAHTIFWITQIAAMYLTICFRKSFWSVPNSQIYFSVSLWPVFSYSGTVTVMSLWHLWFSVINTWKWRDSYKSLIIILKTVWKKVTGKKINIHSVLIHASNN